ncbi:MAG TPA: NAD-dependent epimerase/dehydratase family protein [Myxococcota bacterium]
MARVLIAGCGYLGSELARRLAAEGHTVFGLRRTPGALPDGVQPVVADLCQRDGLRAALAEVERGGIDAVAYTAAAERADDEAYRRAYVEGLANVVAWADAQGMRPPRVLFTSSTAVYAQDDGSWVDEESPTEPVHFAGRRMLEAERLLAPVSGVAVRLGGLYGPGRTRLVEAVRSGQARIRPGPPRWTNRIHRDDAAGALHHLIERALRGEPLEACYVGVDDEPADEAEVLRWLAERLGVPPPAPAPGDAAPPARGGNKRCRNARLRASGYRFTYPSFREGYGALIGAAR